MPQPPPQPPDAASVSFPHDRARIEALVNDILAGMARRGYTESSRFAVRLALEEALSNAFHHGHKGLPEETPIRVDYRIADDQLEVTIEDQGPGFNPASVPDPTLDENLELPSGRGLVLIRAYMTEVQYLGRGNRLRLVYTRPPAKGAAG
ncbi:MAG: ATP-binding protein [Phycisphaerales bacterium]